MSRVRKKYNNQFAILLITFITVLIYSNSFDASWHLDDYMNLTLNPGIHMSDLYPDSIIRSFHASLDRGAYKGESLYRPTAMFTFALNWYWWQDQVFGYHLVNTIIHILSGIFLFLTVQALLKTPRVEIQDPSIQYQAALISALIWTIHPIHTSAVTYIVQRMASMAGMFYIMGLYFYIKLRLSSRHAWRMIFFCGYVCAFALAFFTKENSILLLPATFLLELIFFQQITLRSFIKPKVIVSFLLLILFLGGAAIIWTGGDLTKLFNGYSNRPYTPVERLMTQSRVICLYLYQIIYPVASQFSLEHDIAISRSLFSPWTTLPSTLFIIFLLVAGVILQKKSPLAGFAILFFFLNHAVESTVLNLELIFEHRNYIPSMFLFVPIAVWVTTFLIEYQKKKDKKILFLLSCFFITGILFAIGMGTYIRNFDWKTEKTLWESAMIKAPGRARSYHNLAKFYYEKIGAWEMAAKLHEKAIPLRDSNPSFTNMMAYASLHLAYLQTGDLKKALEYGKKAAEAKWSSRLVVLNYIQTLLSVNDFERASSVMQELLKVRKPSVVEFNFLTRIYLKTGKPVLALQTALKAIQKAPFNIDAQTYYGYVNLLNHQYERAERYLKKALKSGTPYHFFVRLCLIQNSLDQNDGDKIQFYAKQLVDILPLKTIIEGLKEVNSTQDPLVFLSLDKIKNAILSQIEMKYEEFKDFKIEEPHGDQ